MKLIAAFLISIFVGCAPSEMSPVEQPGEVIVNTELQRRQVASGESGLLVVTVDTKDGWSAEVTPPLVDGLIFEPVPMQVSETFGRRTATFEFHLEGEDGAYVIPSFTVAVERGDESLVNETPTLFFDVGSSRFSSDLMGLSTAPPRPESPWPKRLGLAAIIVIAIGLIVALYRWLKQRAAQPKPLPPEDEEALLAWELVCGDSSLTDHERALALSRIFRRYLERRFLFGASAMTSSEVLSYSAEVDFTGDISDVERLLSATDLIKFAGRRGGVQLFTDLGTELVEFISNNGNISSVQPVSSGSESGDV